MAAQPVTKKKTPGKIILRVLAILLVLLLILFGIGYYYFFTTEKYDFDDFSISLPHAMKKSDDLSPNALSWIGMEKYSSSVMNFAYVVVNMESYGGIESMNGMSEEQFVDMFISLQEGTKSMTSMKRDGNVLTGYATNDSGQKKFEYFVFEFHNDKVYVFMFESLSKNQSVFEKLFKKWADSVQYND